MQAQSAVSLPNQVVVIDDDVAVRASLKFSLEIEGYAVRAFAGDDGQLDAADLPERGCLVIDYNLAGTDGLAVLDALRRRGVLMPAILITSDPSPALRARAAAAGIPNIEKPLLGNTLLDTLRDAFTRSAGTTGA